MRYRKNSFILKQLKVKEKKNNRVSPRVTPVACVCCQCDRPEVIALNWPTTLTREPTFLTSSTEHRREVAKFSFFDCVNGGH